MGFVDDYPGIVSARSPERPALVCGDDFVASMPVTSSGKIRKHALRKPYWQDQSRGVN